ncbi:MAG: hypothetical protein JSW09_06895, partial [Pseudomonadota bacterium]
MNPSMKRLLLYGAIIVIAMLAPMLAPDFRTQMAFLWVMIIFALCWDLLGGQMGYNSFGNILFFGVGMYACAVIQRDSGLGYFAALFLGMGVGALLALLFAAVLGYDTWAWTRPESQGRKLRVALIQPDIPLSVKRNTGTFA